MPESTILEKLAYIKGVGVWHGHQPESPDADYASKTIVYGFNGTGKTSLSRVFSSLEANAPVDGLGKGASFQVKFSDGTTATEADFMHPLGNHLLVFNSDFISRNFRWDEGSRPFAPSSCRPLAGAFRRRACGPLHCPQFTRPKR